MLRHLSDSSHHKPITIAAAMDSLVCDRERSRIELCEMIIQRLSDAEDSVRMLTAQVEELKASRAKQAKELRDAHTALHALRPEAYEICLDLPENVSQHRLEKALRWSWRRHGLPTSDASVHSHSPLGFFVRSEEESKHAYVLLFNASIVKAQAASDWASLCMPGVSLSMPIGPLLTGRDVDALHDTLH